MPKQALQTQDIGKGGRKHSSYGRLSFYLSSLLLMTVSGLISLNCLRILSTILMESPGGPQSHHHICRFAASPDAKGPGTADKPRCSPR